MNDCKNLQEYESNLDAKVRAEYLNKTTDMKIYHYQCPICFKWHLTIIK